MILPYLLDIYNFITIQNPIAITIQFSLLQSYPPITNILINLYSDKVHNEQPQILYHALKQFISKEEQTLGPKRFKKLIENLFIILTQFVVNSLRKDINQVQHIFLHLTYYKKYCAHYIDSFYQSSIYIFYILANFKLHKISLIEEKIKQTKIYIRLLLKDKQKQTQTTIIVRLCALLEQFLYFKQNDLKKSKDFCSKILNRSSLEYSECIKFKKQPTLILKLQLLFCTLVISQIYKFLDDNQLHTYMVNKCIQYSTLFLDDNRPFLQYLQVDQLEPKNMTIKLTRIQQKIRRIQFVQQQTIKKERTLQQRQKMKSMNSKFINKNIESDKIIFGNRTNKSKQQFSIKKIIKGQKSKTIHQSENRLPIKHLTKIKNLNKQCQKGNKQQQSELKNLLIIKDKKKNYYRLKQQTMKYLNKQNRQLNKIIKLKSHQIKQIHLIQTEIKQQYDVKELKTQIKTFQNQKNQLIKEIQRQKWQHLDTLPAVKKINVYFKTFAQDHYYSQAKNIYSLVYGQMINKSQMKLVIALRRKALRKNKQVISQVVYNNLKHQMEFVRQIDRKNNNVFYDMKIYQTQKGLLGLNHSQKITQQQYRVIKYEPFYNYYSIYKSVFMSFQEHFQKLTLKQNYYVHKFIRKLKHNSSKLGRKMFKKITIQFDYTNRNSTLTQPILQNKKNTSPIKCVFFIVIQQNKSKHLSQAKQYKVTVQRIDTNHSKKDRLTSNILQTLSIDNPLMINKQFVNNIMINHMNQQWQKSIISILKIQKSIRRLIARSKARQMSEQTTIKTYKIKDILYTIKIVQSKNQRLLYIENYIKNQLHIQKDICFKSLDFLPKIRQKLQGCSDLQQHFKIIQKYMKVKHFAQKIFYKSKNIRFFTDFQTQFKNKLCFTIIKNQFLFRGKMRQGKIMYMLTVKEFATFPRPYSFRIFTLDKCTIVSVDASRTIYNMEKIFLQIVEILSFDDFQILLKAKVQIISKTSARISRISNFSFQSNNDNKNQQSKSIFGYNVINNIKGQRQKSIVLSRLRHKALIKKQDLQDIKRLVSHKDSQEIVSQISSDSSMISKMDQNQQYQKQFIELANHSNQPIIHYQNQQLN